MNIPLQIPSPVQQIELPWLKEKGIELFIKRDDLIHPHIQGNKWRKLKYNLLEARRLYTKKELEPFKGLCSPSLMERGLGGEVLLTFGGAYSNHIYATAAAAHAFGFKSIGVIRGEKPPVLSPTLQFALSQGMHLHFVERAAYADKEKLVEQLKKDFGNFYLIPEGGTNELALKGVGEMIEETGTNFDYYCVAVGTGGTIAGMVLALQGMGKVIGFSSLKGEDTLTGTINDLLIKAGGDYDNFVVNSDYSFGGYAKIQPPLIDFIKQFKSDTGIQLEPVYTGKMFYGLFDLIKKDHFHKGSRILAIHTGGLQGLEGFKELQVSDT